MTGIDSDKSTQSNLVSVTEAAVILEKSEVIPRPALVASLRFDALGIIVALAHAALDALKQIGDAGEPYLDTVAVT